MLMLPFFSTIIAFAQKIFRSFYINLVAAAIIILAGFIIGRLVSKLSYKLMREFEIRSVFKQAGIHAPIERYISTAAAYLIYFISIIMALNQLKIGTIILLLIVGAVLIVLIISFVLGIKDFVPNLKAGYSIYHKRLIRKGDWIETQGTEGRVTDITLTKTKIETKDNEMVYVPHVVILKQGFVKKQKKQEKIEKSKKAETIK